MPDGKCNSKKDQDGFTLIELMLVTAVIAILAAIAYPSYLDQILKTRRSVAKSALVDLAARQTQYYLDNKTYTADLTDLSYSSSPAFIDASGNVVAATDDTRVYRIGVVAGSVSATAFSVEAIPQLGQAADTRCATLRLTSTGQKTATGGGSSTVCW